MVGRSLRSLPFVLLALSWSATEAWAQEEDLRTVSEAGLDPEIDTPRATKRLIVPVPLGNPELGGGLALASVWFYQPGGSVRPWTTGVGAFRTSNGSWGIGAAQMMTLGGDGLRLEFYGGYGRLNRRYYSDFGRSAREDHWVDVREETATVQARARTRVAENLFVGGTARFLRKANRLDEESSDPPGFATGLFDDNVTLVQLGPVLTYDTTHDAFAPREGTIASGQWRLALPALGSDHEYGKLDASLRHFVPSGEANSAAFRAKGCRVGEDAPFFDVCAIDLRGYSNGRFRDRASWSVEAEWRQKLGRRFGAVLFVGAGGTGEDFGDAASSDLLPAVGLGLRYLVAEDYGINLRVDAAIGLDSEAVYVSLGESF